MTKLKSKKMTKSTFAIIIMAIAMVAMLAFGGTYAYFTASTTQKSSSGLTAATISLKGNNIVVATVTNVVPGENILGTEGVSVQNYSDRDSYIFLKIDAKASGSGIATLTIEEESGWTDYNTIDNAVTAKTVYYKLATKVSDENKINGEKILFSDNIKFEATAHNAENDENDSNVDIMGATITVRMIAASTQADELAGDDTNAKIKTAYGLVSSKLVLA